jgi:hypothetical protein
MLIILHVKGELERYAKATKSKTCGILAGSNFF